MRARNRRAAGAWSAALAVAALVAGCATAQPEARTPERIERYEAVLNGAQEVPAVASPASGRAEVDYHPRGNMLHWRITSSGLSGKATAGHIHGPAGPGQNAPAIVPLNVAPASISGQLRITPEQVLWIDPTHPQGGV